MPPRRSKLLLPAAALSAAALLSVPAFAFSQFGTQGGAPAGPSKEGIIAVPLPPLPGTERGTVEPAEGVDDDVAAEPSIAAPVKDAPATGADGPAARSGETAGPDALPAGPSPIAPGPSQVPAPAGAAPQVQPAAPHAGEPGKAGRQAAAPAPAASGDDVAASEAPAESAEIGYGDEGLPRPVKDVRERLMAIARSGDIEALRPYIETGEEATVLSFGGVEGDPIAFLKEISGDGEGVEILAILLEVLESGHTRTEAGTDNEIFVWPYFTQVPIGSLTKPQMVELFELVTAGDYEEMKAFGAYNFYRVGITPDGKLQFFVAGD